MQICDKGFFPHHQCRRTTAGKTFRCLLESDIKSEPETNMVRQKYKLSSYGDTKRLIGESDCLPEPILFREKLYVFDENGRRIGRFSLNIDQEEFTNDANKSVYVHISNRANINGRLSESIVTGTVTHKLKTLEEIRYESTDVPNTGKHERCMFLLRERTKYYLKITKTICNFKTHTHATIPFIEAIGLIGESANAVLLRKLATRGHEGILCLKTVLSNGKRCKNFYVTKLSKQMVNGQLLEVLIVYRNITNHRNCNVTMTLALTRAGQMIYLFWSNSKCFLHIDPDAVIYTHCPTYGESSLTYRWNKDLQLHSLYLDGVDYKMMKYRSFKYEKEELRRLLADFVAYLMLSKPKDVICFAIQYFTAFGQDGMKRCASPKGYSTLNLSECYNFGGPEEAEFLGEGFQIWQGEARFFDGP